MATTRLRWRRYWALVSIAAFLLLALALASQFRSIALQISEETTVITEPLKSDGKQVDYFAALEQETYPETIATDENGYRLILDRLGPSPETEPWQFEQLCEKLGLSSSEVRRDMTYQEPYNFMTACVESPQFGDAEKAIVARLQARYRPETRQSDASDQGQPLAGQGRLLMTAALPANLPCTQQAGHVPGQPGTRHGCRERAPGSGRVCGRHRSSVPVGHSNWTKRPCARIVTAWRRGCGLNE